jgi:predicted phage baseplate assembly protein
LPNSGTVTLNDAGGAACLNLETTNPLGWPPLFSVVTQAQILTPDIFNLLLLFLPSSGPEGVKLPVIVEQVNGISLENAATELAAVSNLIIVKTFEEGPNPSLSANALMNFDATKAVPEMRLTTPVEGETQTWTAAADLLGDGPDDTQFVVEVDTDWSAHLRFGDGTNGKMPPQGTLFTATYRIGNGTAGNVGAGSLTNFSAGVVADSVITSCTNPLPAAGGIDPETSAQIRRRAPAAFMTQERAVTMQDYINVTEQNPQIENAAASLRWTGSWYTLFITAEPQNNANLSPALRGAVTQKVNSYRLAGQDVLIEPPDYVSLYIVLSVCVKPDYFRLDVEKALMQALGSGTLPNGQPALFAPEKFQLGQTVYLSLIYTAARAVPGVQTVRATAFEPQGESTNVYLGQGFIPMGAFQVARLDNDPSLPNHGQLKLSMHGGI